MLLAKRLLHSSGLPYSDILIFNYWDESGQNQDLYAASSSTQTAQPSLQIPAYPTNGGVLDYSSAFLAGIKKIGAYIYVNLNNCYFSTESKTCNVLVKLNATTLSPIGNALPLASDYWGRESIVHDTVNNKLYVHNSLRISSSEYNHVISKIDIDTFTIDGTLVLEQYQSCDNGPWYGGACIGDNYLYLSLKHLTTPLNSFEIVKINLSTFTVSGTYSQQTILMGDGPSNYNTFCTDMEYKNGYLYMAATSRKLISSSYVSVPTAAKVNPATMSTTSIYAIDDYQAANPYGTGSYFTSLAFDADNNVYFTGNIWKGTVSGPENIAVLFKFDSDLSAFTTVEIPCVVDSQNVGPIDLLINNGELWVCECGAGGADTPYARRVSIVSVPSFVKQLTFDTKPVTAPYALLYGGQWIVKR